MPRQCRLCCRCSLPPVSMSTLCPRSPEREESKPLERTIIALTLIPLLLHSSPCCQKPEKESTVAARLQEPTNFVTASSSSSNILSGSHTFHTKFVILTFIFQNTIQEQDETSGCRRGRPLRFWWSRWRTSRRWCWPGCWGSSPCQSWRAQSSCCNCPSFQEISRCLGFHGEL